MNQNIGIKGEYVVLLSGAKEIPDEQKPSPDELIAFIGENITISRMDAIKLAAHLLDLPKKVIYKQNLIQE